MSLVLDCFVALAWQFEDEGSLATDAILALVTDRGAIVPGLWHLEVANALRSAVRRGKTSPAFRDAALADLRPLRIAVDDETDRHAWSATPALSDRFGLTPYDAAYVELAARRGLPLATLDRAMRDAGGRLGLTLLGLDA